MSNASISKSRAPRTAEAFMPSGSSLYVISKLLKLIFPITISGLAVGEVFAVVVSVEAKASIKKL